MQQTYSFYEMIMSYMNGIGQGAKRTKQEQNVRKSQNNNREIKSFLKHWKNRISDMEGKLIMRKEKTR